MYVRTAEADIEQMRTKQKLLKLTSVIAVSIFRREVYLVEESPDNATIDQAATISGCGEHWYIKAQCSLYIEKLLIGRQQVLNNSKYGCDWKSNRSCF